MLLTYEPSDLWIRVPRDWPDEDGRDLDGWAAALAGEGELSAERGAALASLARGRSDGASDATFVHMVAADAQLLTVDVAMIPAEGEEADRHRFLGRADVPGQLGEVQVAAARSSHLGDGTSVLRFDAVRLATGRSAVVGSMRIFWRVGDVDVAVDVSAASPQVLVERLPAAFPLVDSLRLVEDREGPPH